MTWYSTLCESKTLWFKLAKTCYFCAAKYPRFLSAIKIPVAQVVSGYRVMTSFTQPNSRRVQISLLPLFDLFTFIVFYFLLWLLLRTPICHRLVIWSVKKSTGEFCFQMTRHSSRWRPKKKRSSTSASGRLMMKKRRNYRHGSIANVMYLSGKFLSFKPTIMSIIFIM